MKSYIQVRKLISVRPAYQVVLVEGDRTNDFTDDDAVLH